MWNNKSKIWNEIFLFHISSSIKLNPKKIIKYTSESESMLWSNTNELSVKL